MDQEEKEKTFVGEGETEKKNREAAQAAASRRGLSGCLLVFQLKQRIGQSITAGLKAQLKKGENATRSRSMPRNNQKKDFH